MTHPQKGSIPLPGLRWRGLNLQLFALIFLPLTGFLLLIVFSSLNLHQDAMRTLVGERDERAVRTAASAIKEQLNHRVAAVRSLGLRAADQAIPSEILASSQYLLPDFDYGLAFFTPNTDLIDHTGGEVLWENLPEVVVDFLLDIQTQAGVQAGFSEVMDLPELEEKLVFVAYSAGEGFPLAVGAFSPTRLAEPILAGVLSSSDNSSLYLVDQKNQTVFQIGEFSPSEDPASHPGIAEALRGESGTTLVSVEDDEHVIAFSPVYPVGWALVMEEPWQSVVNPMLFTTQLAPLVLVPLLLVALIALWFGARRIIGPLQALETKASELAWGNYQSIKDSVGGIEEIENLQQTLVHLSGKVQQAQSGLRDYIGAITTGQEEERQRLARELHDETIQSLIALNQRIQLAQLKTTIEPETHLVLGEIQSLADQTIQDLRRVIRALRPLYLEDLGLVPALKMLVQEFSTNAGCEIAFNTHGTERRLRTETELALYRIAQEGLTNIMQHAQAAKAELRLEYSPEKIQMVIEDNGRGFDVPDSPAEFTPGGHFGLLGMHERAELIGARLHIDSARGQGTRLVISSTSL